MSQDLGRAIHPVTPLNPFSRDRDHGSTNPLLNDKNLRLAMGVFIIQCHGSEIIANENRPVDEQEKYDTSRPPH